jgi:hypothetical protein
MAHFNEERSTLKHLVHCHPYVRPSRRSQNSTERNNVFGTQDINVRFGPTAVTSQNVYL